MAASNQFNVITVSAADLRSFTETVEKLESQGYGCQEGLFKMKVNQQDRERATSLPEVLKLLKGPIQQKCVYQEFRKYPKCQDVYGYRTIPSELAGTSSMKSYLKRMLSQSSYTTEETCCSKIIKKCDESYAALTQHFFDVLQSCSLMKSSGRSTSNDYDIEQLIESGHKIRGEYEQFLSSLGTGNSKDVRSEVREKDIFDICNCEDCFTESEEEDDISDARATRPVMDKSQPPSFLNYPKYAAGIQLHDNTVKVVEGFGLSDIYSVLNLLPQTYRGLQLPYFYVGEEHSSFPAHVEDGFLLSANYLHYGNPKVWISTHPRFHEQVSELLRRESMELAHTSCFNSLAHKYYFPTLSFFEKNRIPYHVTVQHPGEFVILYPRTIHFGFNLGPNINEAVNFGTRTWIPEGLNSSNWRCRCFGDSMIHLDVKPLLAAFYPEKLKKLLRKDSESNKCSEKPVKGKVKKVKTFKCLQCEASFIDHRQRLIDHVNSKHPEIIGEVEEMYPRASKSSIKGIVCSACSFLVVGNMAHLERHVIAQSKNSVSNEELKEKHRQLLVEVQGRVKRKKRAMKQL